VRHAGVAVGVLGAEVVEDLGALLVPQPLVVVDDDVAVVLAVVGDALRRRGGGMLGPAVCSIVSVTRPA